MITPVFIAFLLGAVVGLALGVRLRPQPPIIIEQPNGQRFGAGGGCLLWAAVALAAVDFVVFLLQAGVAAPR